MAETFIETGEDLKQESAISAAMEEFGLARSKVMQGLKEYRDSNDWLLPLTEVRSYSISRSVAERRLAVHSTLARLAWATAWFRHNPDAHFLGVPAGSSLEIELLSRKSPRDPHK
jgi:hypothetical protein